MGFRSHRLEPLALFRILLSCSIAALLPFIAALASLAAPSDDSYLKQLIEEATVARLAEQREWHVLLHYPKKLFGSGFTSMQDDPGFFMAPTGKTDPQAELAGPLRPFFFYRTGGRAHDPGTCS